MGKEVISTNRAPRAVGPYSQAIDAGDYIFISGQLPIDPVEEKFLGGDIKAQTERVLQNIEGIVQAAGLLTDDVVRTTIYMVNLNDLVAMNEVYARFFPKDPPARCTLQVSALPRGVKIMIDAVARR